MDIGEFHMGVFCRIELRDGEILERHTGGMSLCICDHIIDT
jgi:hypothetical protein